MKLMTLEEFMKTPNDTLFSVCKKRYIDPEVCSEILLETEEGPYIKTGDYNGKFGRIGWNGAMNLLPTGVVVDQKQAFTNWCSWDNSDADYTDDEYVFIVYERNEIQQMMNILSVALGQKDANLPDNNVYFVNDEMITEDELFRFTGKDKRNFDYGSCDCNLWKLLRDYILSMDKPK